MMHLQRCFSLIIMMFAALMMSGCASSFFPDFEETEDVVIDAGGNVEVRKVREKGVLVADKENAAYEGEELTDEEDRVVPAKVIEVKSEEITPIENDNVKVVEASSEDMIVSRNNEVLSNDDNPSESEDKKSFDPEMHYLAMTIYFENGGAVVSPSYNDELRKIAKLVKDHDAMVTVYGFASSRTRDTDPASHKLANFKISAERAKSTVKALSRVGVPLDKITFQALSDSMPMYQEVMPEGERLNRRAEIYLTY